MSDKEDGNEPVEKPFYVDRAKTGRASCKKCKQKIAKDELRFAKLAHNPFGSGTIKQWHHITCVFEVFKKQRPTSKKIENPDEIGGWETLNETDREEIMSHFSTDLRKTFETTLKSSLIHDPHKTPNENVKENKNNSDNRSNKDNAFKTFRKICAQVSNNSSYLAKTKVIAEFFEKGSDGNGFQSDIELWCRLLLPGTIIRVYNLQSKQLIKLFSRILEFNQEDMLEHLELGDVAETISVFFMKSKSVKEAKKSTLTLQEIDHFLDELSQLTKEDEQTDHFKKITKKCTANDLKMIIRLVKHDLRINAGPKHVLEALHKDAYEAFQTTRDIKSVVSKALKARKLSKDVQVPSSEGMDIDIRMMTPVLPMLAQPCKSVQVALEKCPNGIFSEVKYDGERVQLHKQGDTFKYFSRSLKPVLPHKVNHFKDYIPEAFPHAQDLILDAEVLMVDNNGKPLPFGTLGIHKKTKFKDANVCLFVFDCIYYNGKSLLKVPLKDRKSILKNNMVEVKNRIMFSEMEIIQKPHQLEKMITKVFQQGLEGLVLKDKNSIYEPGKRHWLKIKKDYLGDGAMADSADLLVLGAWYGTGTKGGLMSSFLMGCHNPDTKKWLTVTKVSNGHDDETLDRIQHELDMVKISKDSSRLPSWLICTKTMVPDFVAADPKKMPVWEITGAEFTCNQVHTADGISIRFPRVTRIRRDKDWLTATNLNELKHLYKSSKDTTDFTFVETKTSTYPALDPNSDDDLSLKRKRPKNHANDDEQGRNKRPKLPRQNDKHEDTDIDPHKTEETLPPLDMANPLPDIFSDCVLEIPKNYKNYHFLRRYLIAYNAHMYDTHRNSSVEGSLKRVTHVVHLSKSTSTKSGDHWSNNVRHVHINWVWDSIKLLERQPEACYVVTLSKD